MTTTRSQKKRFLRWSCRTGAIMLFLCIAVFTILIVRELVRQQNRRNTIEYFRERGGRITVEEEESPWYMAIVGQRTRDVEVGAFLNKTIVSDDDLRYLSSLPNLRVVYLDHTQISDEGIVHVAALSKVDVLDLESTAVTDKGVEVLTSMDSLEWLSLNDTRVTDQALSYCVSFRNLDTVSMFGTQVTSGAVDSLKNAAPELRILWSPPAAEAHTKAQLFLERKGAVFDRGQLPGKEGEVIYLVSLRRDGRERERWTGSLDDLDHLRDIQGLVGVFLEGDGFGDETVERLSTITGLRGLEVEDATVTDKSLKYLESLNSLKGVGLSGTSVTDAGIVAFKRARPDVQVTNREW